MGTIILLQKPDISGDAIVCEPTTMAAWVTFVKEGEVRANHNLSEDLESFLVFTLMRFVKRTDLFSNTLALDYLKASTEYTGEKKEHALSEIGDTSLILAGLYPEHSQRLNVSASYFSEMGMLAFMDLALSFEHQHKNALATLYRNVSKGFPFMANILLAVREKRDEHNEVIRLLKKPGFLSPPN